VTESQHLTTLCFYFHISINSSVIFRMRMGEESGSISLRYATTNKDSFPQERNARGKDTNKTWRLKEAS